jgi:hypothetical protein
MLEIRGGINIIIIIGIVFLIIAFVLKFTINSSLAYLIGGFGLALIAFGQAFKKFKSGH